MKIEKNEAVVDDKDVEIIEAQNINDLVNGGEINVEKTEKNSGTDTENFPKRRRGRPRKEDIEARKKEQARQCLESINLIIPDPYKLTDFEIGALVETGADKIIRLLGGANDSDMAFWMVLYGIIDARLHITQKMLQVVQKRMKK